MWLYIPSQDAQAAAALKWDSTLPVPELSHLSFTWNDRDMRPQSWPRVWKKEPCIRRLSGLTLKPCAAQSSAITFARQLAAKALAASRLDTPASPSPSPASSVARTIRDTYGQRSVRRLRAIGLACVFSRTSQATLLSDSIPFSLIYERWATALRRACLQRRKSVLRIAGSGCSSWQTPEASVMEIITEKDKYYVAPDGKHRRVTQKGTDASVGLARETMMWQTPHGMANTDKTGKKGGAGGGEFALQANRWATPNSTDSEQAGGPEQKSLTKDARAFPSSPPAPLTDPPGQESSQGGQGSRRLWRTPSNQEPGVDPARLEGGNGHRAYDKETGRLAQYGLTQQVQMESGTKKRLNPNFVDWLMGYPIGHSDCDSTATASSLNAWRRLSSACLRHWLARVTENSPDA